MHRRVHVSACSAAVRCPADAAAGCPPPSPSQGAPCANVDAALQAKCKWTEAAALPPPPPPTRPSARPATFTISFW
eukprot:361415-Chlamydomonas_euryale.AAC.3